MERTIDTLEQLLSLQQEDVVEEIVAEQFAQQPNLARRYDASGRERCQEDTAYHLSYLSQAVIYESPELFADYVAWVHTVLSQRNIPTHDLEISLRFVSEVVTKHLPAAAHPLVQQCIAAGLEQLQSEPKQFPPFIAEEGPLAVLAQQYIESLLRFDRQSASQLIMDAVEAGTDLMDLYISVFQTVQYEIGRLWQINRITVAQEHYCTAATQLILSQLFPHILSAEPSKGTVVVACAGSELHELGARMVADFFELDGWRSLYLAANLPARDLLATLEEHMPDLLCLSVTMSYHLPLVKNVLELIRKHQSLHTLPVIVGGYPFRIVPDLWQKIGADGYGVDARSAVEVANQLISP